jgi:hypothetical protein
MKYSILEPQEFEPRTDCHVGAAILGAGALGAGASIFGANKAANAQTAAANAAINAQQQMFNTSKQELQPFIDSGKATLPELQAFLNTSDPNSPLASLLKLTTPGADMTATLEQTPGFQFANTYGQKAVGNALAARGLAGPGGALAKGSANYAEGLAQTTWQNVVNALTNSVTTGANTLQNLTNTGAGAASSLAGNATTTGQGISSSLIGAGNAQAGAATAGANAIGGLGQSASSAVLLNQLLGGGGGGLYANPINAGTASGVSDGGFNFLDAAA